MDDTVTAEHVASAGASEATATGKTPKYVALINALRPHADDLQKVADMINHYRSADRDGVPEHAKARILHESLLCVSTRNFGSGLTFPMITKELGEPIGIAHRRSDDIICVIVPVDERTQTLKRIPFTQTKRPNLYEKPQIKAGGLANVLGEVGAAHCIQECTCVDVINKDGEVLAVAVSPALYSAQLAPEEFPTLTIPAPTTRKPPSEYAVSRKPTTQAGKTMSDLEKAFRAVGEGRLTHEFIRSALGNEVSITSEPDSVNAARSGSPEQANVEVSVLKAGAEDLTEKLNRAVQRVVENSLPTIFTVQSRKRDPIEVVVMPPAESHSAAPKAFVF